ncbi:MAG: alpha/beta hydrolase [Victivallaceae bacterium]|jgi:hypothetical protein
MEAACKRSGSKHSLRRLLLIIVITVLAFLGFAGCFSDKLIFQPPRSGVEPDKAMTMLQVAPEVKIALLYLPSPAAAYTLLYSHGNGEDLFDLKSFLAEYNSHGYSVLCYDYEGCGASQSKPDEQHTYRDIEAVYRYMTGTLKIPPDKIILYGRSVGSGPTCYLAEKSPAAGMVLQSPFTSAFKVVCPVPLPFDKFPNLARIGNIKMPILIMHGRLDGVIPFLHGQTLFKAANQPKYFFEVPEAGHNDLELKAGDNYWRELDKFVKSLPDRK